MTSKLELPNPEPEDSENLIIEEKKLCLAWAYLNRILSDDNPSDENKLTSFEQAILFEFKELIYLEDYSSLYEELLEIAKKMDKGDYDDTEDDNEEGDVLEDIEEEEDPEEVIKKIASYVLQGEITDDIPGKYSLKTALEEIVVFKLGEMTDDEIEKVKLSVLSKMTSLRGGGNFFRYEKLKIVK